MSPLMESLCYHRPFDCDDWDELCAAIIEVHNPHSNFKLESLLSNVRYMRKFINYNGSWNIPWSLPPLISNNAVYSAYKAFRCTTDFGEITSITYEFHPANVIANKWLSAEISGSNHLSGLTTPNEAKFHMLLDAEQADTYINSRKNAWGTDPCGLTPFPVKSRQLKSIDLIYVPPKQFLWGIDAKEIYIPL